MKKIYIVFKLKKMFEPSYEIDAEYDIKTTLKEALDVYESWKKEAKELIEDGALNEVEETEFPLKKESASYEVTDSLNSIILNVETKLI